MKSQNIAIIGSGIAGLTTAHLLSREHRVTVFEANDYIGGHTHTVPVSMDGTTLAVDTGFIVCNDRNYPHFLSLMQRLGVGIRPTEMSFSVRNPALNLEYNGHNLNTLFGQRRNLLRPGFYRLVRDILRFNRASKSALDSGGVDDITLGAFVKSQGLSALFRDNYLLPMVAAIWSCSLRQASDFPLAFFLRFFRHHGLLDVRNRPQWYVVEGGSQAYVEPLTRDFADRIHLRTPVTAVARTDAAVEISYGGLTECFDQVVLACHSDQALALLHDPTDRERDILGALEYQDNDVILHSDARLLPRTPRCRASWNFIAGDSALDSPPVVTYSMNILQGLQSSEPLLVTLNARERIAREKIIAEFSYAHPVYSRASMAAQARRGEICGRDRLHYCGAYWYDGFHEDGVRSALDVAARFGLSP
ncbi:MAG: FAD-dependent oxidoreductase [Pseudohongiellaceae bacterium]